MLHTEWPQHLKTIRNITPTPFDISTATEFKNTFNEFVIQGEDHKAFKINIYCPIHHYEAVQTTWNDPTTFQPYHLTPTRFFLQAPSMIPQRIQKRYSWGINPKADPPTGMVLLKATKDYKKGRTILNYKGNIIARLLQCTTIALNFITEQLFPNVMGTKAVPTIFQHLHEFLRHMPPHTDLDETTHYEPLNDDLVGFFNSIPQQDIISSTNQLLAMYSQHVGKPLPTIQFTIDLLNPQQNSLTEVFFGNSLGLIPWGSA